MPRPNVLPEIDWRTVFNHAQSYPDWRVGGEKPENQERMERLRRELVLTPQTEAWLRALPQTVHVLVMAEDWCPDVVRHVPVLERLAGVGDRVRTAYVRRDTNPEVTARFHTNGTESVPKFGFFSEDFAWCGQWGPLPEACNELIRRGRACNDLKTARQHVAKLYEGDPGRLVVIAELVRCIEIAATEQLAPLPA